MKTVQELITLRELISNICDDLQHYFNDTPVMDVEVDVVIRLLDLMEMYKARYIDSVGCVPGYPEVRPDIYAPDPDDTEDKDVADALDDFDIDEIEKTMEKPTDYNSRKPFRPALMGIYKHVSSGSTYQCIAINDADHTYTMRNLKSPHWTFNAHCIYIYNNYSIDWAYSTDGHFEKEL